MWLPQSSCGPHCMRGEEVRVAGPVRRAVRVAGLAGIAVLAVPIPLLPRAWREPAVRGCAWAALRVLGVRWRCFGRLPRRRALVVANHISWLDIVVLLAAGRIRPVAKVEVRDWPLVGRIAAGVGAVFLDRSRPRTLPGTVAEVRDALAAGAVVGVFPEGTTSCGEGAEGFRPAFFQAAVDTATPVVPVTLRFLSGGEPTARPAFVGPETLLDSLRRIPAMRGLTVRVGIGAAIHPGPAATRGALARIAGTAVGCPPRPRPVPLAPVVPIPTAARVRVGRAA
jgi:1-acyl-sn-glycerol-3-phosphate acyltransferase